MNIHSRLSKIRMTSIALLCVIPLFTGMFPVSPGICEMKTGDDLISLHVQNKALGEVLQAISEMTGYLFVIDGKWEDLPVSTSFQNLALHSGLQRILKNLNNAIIYSSDGEITIVIYDTDRAPLGTIPYNDKNAQDNDQTARAALEADAPASDSILLAESGEPVAEPLSPPTEGRDQESPEQIPEPAAEESKPEIGIPPEETQSMPEENRSAADSGSAGMQQRPPEP